MPASKGYIQRRKNTYYAVLGVPKDVRSEFGGKRLLVQSLKTGSKSQALRRALPVVAAWKAEFEAARNGGLLPTHKDDAAVLREALAKAKSPTARAFLLEQIEELAHMTAPTSEDDPEGDDPEALARAKALYAEATGAATTSHLEDWLSGLDNEQKTIDLKRADINRLAVQFPTLDQITRRGTQRLCEEMLRDGGLARASVARTLSAWRGYWRYLQSLEVVPDDLAPFDRLSLSTGSAKAAKHTARLPFDLKDISRLVKAAEDKRDATLAALIRLAAWTGARIEELSALPVDRVNLKAGYFEIADSKTAAGIRQVPIHPKLKAHLRELVKNSKDGYVLSGLTPNKYGDRSNAIGKRFGRLKADEGFGPRHVFHSIRRTVVTALENAGVPEGVCADIVGHEKPTMTYGHYSGGSSLAVKADAIRKLNYPGV